MSFNVIGKTVMRSLFGKPATAMYPVVLNEFYPNTRGRIELNVEDCIFCGMCSRRCPCGAIEVNRQEKKWEIDRTRCIVCDFCVHVCPKTCLTSERQYTAPMSDKSTRFTTIFGETGNKDA